jgi:AhpD family alkylhydroperoxidase
MEPRLDFYTSGPDAMKAMAGLEEQIARSGLERPLVELVRLRASQINGCAYCVDLHVVDARKAGEGERRLATVAVWRETPFFNARERAAREWTESLTRVADTRVPDEVWKRVEPHFTPVELVDLTLLVGTINVWNRFAIAFRKCVEAWVWSKRRVCVGAWARVTARVDRTGVRRSRRGCGGAAGCRTFPSRGCWRPHARRLSIGRSWWSPPAAPSFRRRRRVGTPAAVATGMRNHIRPRGHPRRRRTRDPRTGDGRAGPASPFRSLPLIPAEAGAQTPAYPG